MEYHSHEKFPLEVGIWVANPGAPLSATIISKVYTLLSENELSQAKRFYSATDAHRFMYRKFFVRVILAQYLKIFPEEIEYSYGLHGKPQLVGHPEWQFNISHSHGVAVLAVIAGQEVGIDIEYMDANIIGSELVKITCSDDEQTTLRQLPKMLRPLSFWRLWTAKESYLKASGQGLGVVEPRTVQFTSQSIENVSTELQLANDAVVTPWKFVSFSPVEGFLSTLALQTNHPVRLKKHVFQMK